MFRYATLVFIFLISHIIAISAGAQSTPKNELFKDVEVRIIKQKYFQKSNRFEFNGNFNGVMNKAFVYSMQGNAQLGFHLNEQLGVFGEAGMGFSGNKTECDLLGEKFKIEPIVWIPENWYGGGVTYTPVYGKFQMSNGDVLYFDWLFSLELGMANIMKRESSCVPDMVGNNAATFSKLQYTIGIGQRYFINKDVSLQWNVKFFAIDNPEYEGDVLQSMLINPQLQMLLSLGVSYFL